MAAALSPATRASKRLIHTAFSYPIMGRLRADPGEKHEPRVAISSPAEKQYLYFVAYQFLRPAHSRRRRVACAC